MSILVFLSLFWAGLVFGASFIAQSAKFATPGLRRTDLIAAGRQMFVAIHRCEAALALAGCAAMAHARQADFPLLAASAILALQAAWLMPALTRRLAVLRAGGPAPRDRHHLVYALLETAKLLLLLVAPVLALLANH